MARIAVVGPGSVGVFFAGHLAAAGHEVTACARRPFERYLIESSEAPLDIAATVEIDPAAITDTVEWVLLAVKAHQTEGAAGWLERLCDGDTKVIVVQNGIEHERAGAYCNGASIIPSVVYCGAELVNPGHIQHSTAGHLFVSDQPFGEELLALFADSKAEVRPTPDFATQQWRKLSLNVVANGLTALTDRTLSVIGEPGARAIAIRLLQECWTVAQADGADLDPAGAEDLVDLIVKSGNDTGTSMLYDTRAGRPTEHDAIHGSALRRAQVLGIDTPTIATIHDLLDARSAKP